MPLSPATAAGIGQDASSESDLNHLFLLPIGIAQLVGAFLRLLIGLLISFPTESAGLRLLTVTASFLLYSLTGLAILLTHLTAQLARLKPRATGCLVLCSVSAVFTVFEMHHHLIRAVAEAEAAVIVNSNVTSSSAAGNGHRQIRQQHRLVMVALLLVQCVIVTFASYLCIKLMWTTTTATTADGGGEREPAGPSSGASADAPAAAAVLATSVDESSAAGVSESIELKT
ncbi:hypothetical protein BOX15_Mlig008050g2 [Macrostomum lignano]|uniref:Uncharacterized protein n=1 Tax=Macrostomum lignano TaxID=282301 RepID=A0A267H0U7_9PLAT|nr:hypothetical protein BOX15_Mlig008050g2 [Macrostomum lignano]